MRRRLKTIPAVFLAFLVVTAGAPVILVAAVAIDAARWAVRRRPWMAVRLAAFLWVYLSAQVVGLIAMFAAWVGSGFGSSRLRLERSTYRIQAWWAGYLLRAVLAVFSLQLETFGEKAVTPGRAVYMARHSSLIDTLLPAALITSRRGIRLRYVLKKELLADPALDVAGNRIPNYFVDRTSRRGRTELEGVSRLAEGLGPDEGLLIYPEGTRFRRDRQQQAIARLSKDTELHALASALHNVHPPRPAGTMALLEAGLDAVFIAHSGLDDFATVADVWRGTLVGETIRVRFRRVRAADIPRDPRERLAWLFQQWQRLDADVTDLRSGDGG